MPSSSPATGALLDLARRQLSFDDLCRHVGPSDPGWIEYMGQMSAVWSDGEAALQDDVDWEPLLAALGDLGAANPKSFIWYRIMAASAALLSDDDMLLMSAHLYLAQAIGDTLTLRDAGERKAPTDLISEVCRELPRRPDAYPETRLFAVLGELVTAELGEPGQEGVATLCDALERIEQELCTSGDYDSPEYLWGVTCFDSNHALWLALVRDHFPADIPKAVELRESLLEHGARWTDTADVEAPMIEDVEPTLERSPARYTPQAISFFLQRARSDRARAVALRLAEDCFDSGVEMTRTNEHFSSWLTGLNNAVHAAHGSGAFTLAARWADLATPYARDNPYLPHNLACAFVGVGRTDDAFAMCALAVETGNPGLAQLRDDEDLGALRSETRFVALFGRHGKRRKLPV